MMRKVSQTSSPALHTTGRGVGFAVFNQRWIYQRRGYRHRTSPESSDVSARRKPPGTLKKSSDLVYIILRLSTSDNVWCITHIHHMQSRLCLDYCCFGGKQSSSMSHGAHDRLAGSSFSVSSAAKSETQRRRFFIPLSLYFNFRERRFSLRSSCHQTVAGNCLLRKSFPQFSEEARTPLVLHSYSTYTCQSCCWYVVGISVQPQWIPGVPFTHPSVKKSSGTVSVVAFASFLSSLFFDNQSH